MRSWPGTQWGKLIFVGTHLFWLLQPGLLDLTLPSLRTPFAFPSLKPACDLLTGDERPLRTDCSFHQEFSLATELALLDRWISVLWLTPSTSLCSDGNGSLVCWLIAGCTGGEDARVSQHWDL